MRLSSRSFVDKLDFVTSPGHMTGGNARARAGLPGRGPQLVVSDKAILNFENPEREMQVVSLHPGVTLDEVRENVGWDIRTVDQIGETPRPTAEELRLIRKVLDPTGMYR